MLLSFLVRSIYILPSHFLSEKKTSKFLLVIPFSYLSDSSWKCIMDTMKMETDVDELVLYLCSHKGYPFAPQKKLWIYISDLTIPSF